VANSLFSAPLSRRSMNRSNMIASCVAGALLFVDGGMTAM
jgi:hypothetical protein